MLSISYLVTVHNEGKTFENLLSRLIEFIDAEDEIVIIDDFSDNPETKTILSQYLPSSQSLNQGKNVRVYQHALDKNYGGHKNYGSEKCKNPWIFQLDGDECPSEVLLLNIKEIIELNPEVEVFALPRINDFRGVTQEHAKAWGWTLTRCSACEDRLIVQWPDYQGRIYKNEPSRIRWDRRLHEKLEGHKRFVQLPPSFEIAIYHNKTIETQLATNKRYNEWFSQEENRGHAGWSK